MGRLIDADALEREGWSLGRTFRQDINTMVYEVKKPSDFPTIEERKTGEWIELDCDEDKYDIIKCPCCKHTFTVDSYHWSDIGFVKDDLKFCPECGADMRGEYSETNRQ